MSVSQEYDKSAASAIKAKFAAKLKVFNVLPVALAWGLLLFIFVGLRVYLQLYAFKYGLDSTDPAFETYWMTLFKVEIPLVMGTGVLIWVYLWVTRDRHFEALTPEVELRRYFGLVGWFLVYVFAFFLLAAIFAEGDATWHQTVVRDTPLTPSHIITFYACVPVYLVCGVGSLLYAVTRLPAYAKSYSVPLLMVVIGPGMILPNVGYNEWGHAYWFTEEIFSHPLHWGFPILGWTGLALGGALVQVMSRMSQLFIQLGAATATQGVAPAQPAE